MKILIVQDYLRSGGTERQTVLLANSFATLGHTVTLITFRPGGTLRPTLAANVTHRALQRVDTHLDWFAPGLISQVKKHSPHVILCMGRMANCYGKNLVDRCPRTVVIGTMRTGKNLPWLFRRSLRHVHHIIANSRAAKDVLEQAHRLSPDKISVIHNSLVFPESSTVADRDETLRVQHGAGPHTNVMLDVAMFRPEKNQHELITIAAGLPAGFPWQLWLAGDGPALASCRAHAAHLGVSDRVKFPGLVPNPAPLYAAADLAVHASRSESLSNFLIEAQAHGLPAVAYAAQGVDECFIPGDTGLAIPFGQQDTFRAAIQNYAGRDPARQERARNFARKTFDPVRQVQACLDLFQRLIQP